MRWNIQERTQSLIQSTKNIASLEENKNIEDIATWVSWENLEAIEVWNWDMWSGDKKDNMSKKLFNVSSLPEDTKLTFWNFLPLLVHTYGLPASEHSYNFSFVSKEDALYPVFAIARDYNMIGNATRPDQKILCKHLMVLLWLAEERELTYNASNVFDVFWKEAEKRWYTDHGCEEMNQTAMIKNLP